MELHKIIEDAWSKTIDDFKNTEERGDVGLWTEASLRLNFIRHLNEVAELGRVLAETPFHLGNDDYKPDIISDIKVNDGTKTVAFEMKLFGQTDNWKKDLEKLDRYSIIGWDYGYFLAIGYPQQCDEIQKVPIEKSPLSQYEIRILTEPIPKPTEVPDFKFAELVLKETLGKDIPYVVSEIEGAIAFFEEFALIFDMRSEENKLVVRAGFHDTPTDEQKVKGLGCAYITFDEDGRIHPSKTFTGDVLIGESEFRGMTVNQVVNTIKEPLHEFMKKTGYL
jgi:hypothetical protein